MGDTEDGLAAGKKLLISCKIGDYENIMNLLDQIEEMEQADKVCMATTTNSLFGNHALEGLDWRGTVSPSPTMGAQKFHDQDDTPKHASHINEVLVVHAGAAAECCLHRRGVLLAKRQSALSVESD